MFFRTVDPNSTVSSPEQREERQRMEKLLQRYNKCSESFSGVSCHSASSLPSLPSDTGLRNATLRGRRSSMIKKVSCPVVPVGNGLAMDVTGCDKSPGACPPPSHRFSSISTTTTASSGSDRSAESEQVEQWLRSIHFDEYVNHFLDAGYDLPTISRITPEDLIAIGITNPLHRKQIKHEISRLSVSDGIPASVPGSLFEWLYLLRLDEYEEVLRSQGYDTVDRLAQLTWEDYEDIGIRKLGHQKRLALATKRYISFVKQQNAAQPFTSSSPYSSSSSGISSFSTSSSITGSFPDLTRTSSQSFGPAAGMIETETVSLMQRPHRGTSVVYQKPKPVAMITASRPASSASSTSFCDFVQDLKCKTGLGPSDLLSSASTCSLHSNTSFASDAADASHYARHNYSSITYDTSSIYATLKRNKRPPPPPPKRTNSVKSSASNYGAAPESDSGGRFDSLTSRDSFFDQMQEQAFATCVKSLASKFSQIASVQDEDPDYLSFTGNRNSVSDKRHVYGDTNEMFPPPPPPLHSAVMQAQDTRSTLTGSCEFPPPPTPLCQSSEDLSHAFPPEKQANSPDRSQSSSSNESLPFANDNVGTIRQSHFQPCSVHSAAPNQNLTTIDDLAASLRSYPPSNSSPVFLRRGSTPGRTGDGEKGTVIDDIESMLANLSNQLDAMLEQEIGLSSS